MLIRRGLPGVLLLVGLAQAPAGALPGPEDLVERATDGHVVYSRVDHDFGHNHFRVHVSRYVDPAPYQDGVEIGLGVHVTVYSPLPDGTVQERHFAHPSGGHGGLDEPLSEGPVFSQGELFFAIPPGFDRDAVVDLELYPISGRPVVRGFHNTGPFLGELDQHDAIPDLVFLE